PAADDCARRGGRACRAARGLRGRAVSLRHPRRRHLRLVAVRRRTARARSRRGFHRTDLLRADEHSGALHLRGDDRADRAARRRHGRAGRAVPRQCRRDQRARPPAVDSSVLLPQDGMLGRLLHTLIGYTDRPTELQLLAYLGTLALMAGLAWVATPARSPRPAV